MNNSYYSNMYTILSVRNGQYDLVQSYPAVSKFPHRISASIRLRPIVSSIVLAEKKDEAEYDHAL